MVLSKMSLGVPEPDPSEGRWAQVSPQHEQVGVVEKVPLCPWCEDPVASEGQTCSFDCYVLWFAWHWDHEDAVVVTPSGRLVALEENQTSPLDMPFQPWYAAEVSVSQGGS